MGNDNLYKKFYDELEKDYSVTKEQFIEYDFKFCGICDPPKETYFNKYGKECIRYIEGSIPNVGEQLFPYRSSYFKKKHPTKYIDEITFKLIVGKFIYKRECICKHYIVCNCFIYSKSQDILLNIGKCCNERFNENSTKRFCELCGEHHKNRKNNFCDDCRKTLFSKCGKCKKSKNLDKYRWCFQCSNNNNNNVKKTYDFCSMCMEPKITENDKQYKNCYNCNNF
jgi:hypothetical protein